MKISDIQNVVALARQGVKVLAEKIDAQQGAQAFASIAAVETWVNDMVQQHTQTQNVDENGQGVEVVEVNNEEIASEEGQESTKNPVE